MDGKLHFPAGAKANDDRGPGGRLAREGAFGQSESGETGLFLGGDAIQTQLPVERPVFGTPSIVMLPLAGVCGS